MLTPRRLAPPTKTFTVVDLVKKTSLSWQTINLIKIKEK
jgi:hypothetical protein